MKVMFLVGSMAMGGAERHTMDLALNLAERGMQCALVSVKPCSPLDHQWHALDNVRLTYCDARNFIDVRAIARLALQVRLDAPDVLVAVNQYALLYAHLAAGAKRTHGPLIVSIFHTTQLRSVKERLQNLCYRRFFSTSDLLVFVCQFQADYWHRKGLHSRCDEVIHNGIDIARFAPFAAAQRLASRRKFGIEDADFVLGITAAFRPEKNHAFLLHALGKLRQGGARVKLLMVGDGPLRNEIERRAVALGLSGHVIFAGACQDVRPCVAAFDAFVLASTHIETFSLAALEAMAMGIPAILSEVGGAREMVQSGSNGLIYAADDLPGFIEAVQRMMAGRLAIDMGAAARTFVSERFSHEKMVDRYVAVLKALLNRHPTGGSRAADPGHIT
jgi:glycosyltransferase involved in cell wall biosynthesis